MARSLTFRTSYRTVVLLAVLALCLGDLAFTRQTHAVGLTPAYLAMQVVFESLAIVLAILAAALLVARLRKPKRKPETVA